MYNIMNHLKYNNIILQVFLGNATTFKNNTASTWAVSVYSHAGYKRSIWKSVTFLEVY